jgi:hypothetical protein
MELIDSKSILAKLMATENLTVEQRAVSTASFDVKNRILTVPILDKNISSQLYDLFMGHEVGHALYTPLEEIKKVYEARNIPLSILNVVEDSRIERKIKNKFPGLRNSFVKGYKELVNRDFFGTAGTNLNMLNLIDRINLFCKGGPAQGIKFTDIEKALLDDVESTETYQDVVNVSEKIMDYMKLQEEERKKEMEELHKQFKLADEEGDEELNEFEEDDFDEFEEDDDFDSEKSISSTKDRIPENIKSFTDEKFRQNEKQLFDEKSRDYHYANIPKIDIEKCILDYKELYSLYKKGHPDSGQPYFTGKKTFAKLRVELNKVVSYLVKEFELKKNADQLKRASISKTGELNMSKIHSYRFSEDIFKKITVIPGGKSHGLVMYIDWSGSMSDHMANTMKQLFSLVLFCKKVNIPYEVYAFSSDASDAHNYTVEPKEGDLALDNFSLMNIFSSRMSASDFSYAASVMCAISHIGQDEGYGYPYWIHLQSTPLNQAVVSAMYVVPHFQKKYKLQIVNTIFLTDGDSDSVKGVYQELVDRNGMKYLTTNSDAKYATLVLRDPVTKHQQIVQHLYNRRELVNSLIRLLKCRTNSNIVGFYILAPREFNRNVYSLLPIGSNVNEILSKFRKEKYTILTSSATNGYDEYYLLKSAKEDIEDEEFKVKENATTKGLVSAFSKYANNKLSNRVVLNRFIDLIA